MLTVFISGFTCSGKTRLPQTVPATTLRPPEPVTTRPECLSKANRPELVAVPIITILAEDENPIFNGIALGKPRGTD